jgi:hypothetical protein
MNDHVRPDDTRAARNAPDVGPKNRDRHARVRDHDLFARPDAADQL